MRVACDNVAMNTYRCLMLITRRDAVKQRTGSPHLNERTVYKYTLRPAQYSHQ